MPSSVRSSSSTLSSSSSSFDKQDAYPVLDEQFLPRIVAVFYSIFHPTEGAKIVYQVPEGIISTPAQHPESSSASLDGDAKDPPANASHQIPIFDFKSISEFIIPKAPLCGRLISYSVASPNGQTYKILSLPIILLDQAKYPRKSFIFNVAFVFDGRADTRAYEPIVRKCARELRDLELSSSFLSRSQFRMYWVIEQLFEDLNSYCESFVALPEAPHTKYVNAVGKEAFESDKDGSLPKEGSRKASWNTPSRPFANGKHIKTSNGMWVGRESLRDALEQSYSIPPLTIGDPTLPTDLSRMGPRRSSIDHLTLASPPHTTHMPPPARQGTGEGSPLAFNSGRKSSSSSLIGSPGLRPSMGRSKTLAALAVNETTVNALQGSKVEEVMPESGAMSRKCSVEGNRTRSGDIDQLSGPSRDDAADMERGLSESIMSLRTVGAAGPRRMSDAVGAVPPAAMLAPGKREPPHGLGRTVRDAINLKLFPTYPNPKDINDWDVPVTLLDLRKRVTGNWDLTMCKVLPFIDGINHVKRIAQLADADLELTRQCIEHLLYYRCIITTDTFQFTNMYTVRPSIAVMAEDDVIMVECPFYVTKPGYDLPSWPKLLSLYSSLRPALTVNEWIEENDIDDLGIDVRRFVSFGVIKGFLRRVHRYPVLLQDGANPSLEVAIQREQSNSRSRERVQEGEASKISQVPVSISPNAGAGLGPMRRGRLRQGSENESSLGGGSVVSGGTSAGRRRAVESHRKTRATVMDVANVALDAAAVAKEQERRAAQPSTSSRVSIRTPLPRGGSSSTIRPVNNVAAASNKDSEELASTSGVRGRRQSSVSIPDGFLELLDGAHPDDELCVRFGKSWSEIFAILIKIGRQTSVVPRRLSGLRRGTLNEQDEESNIAAAAAATASSGWAAGEADESGVAGMSSFYGLGATSSNPRRSITASLPRYRQQSGQGGGQSGFSRYASTGDGATSAWGRLSGLQSGSLNVEEYSQVDRESVARGDLGRVKIIIK